MGLAHLGLDGCNFFHFGLCKRIKEPMQDMKGNEIEIIDARAKVVSIYIICAWGVNVL